MYFAYRKITTKPFIQFDFIGNSIEEIELNGYESTGKNVITKVQIDEIGFLHGVFGKRVNETGDLVDWTAEELNDFRNANSANLQKEYRAKLLDLSNQISLSERLGENTSVLEAEFEALKAEYLAEKDRLTTEGGDTITTEGGDEMTT